MNYIKKLEADIFVTEDAEVTEVIKDNYPYMYEDFKKTFSYHDNNIHYEYLYEIVYKKRVVGVIFFNLYEDHGLIKYAYILPKYRNNGLFGDYYKKLTKKLSLQVNYTKPMIIDEPTTSILGSLIKNELGNEFRWELLLSHIPLRQKFIDQETSEEITVTTFLFDQKLESLIYLEDLENIENSFILPPNFNITKNIQSVEDELKEKRENKVLSDSYFRTINQILHENQVDYQASLGTKQTKIIN